MEMKAARYDQEQQQGVGCRPAMMVDFVLLHVCYSGSKNRNLYFTLKIDSKWVWEPKQVRDERFRELCVFFCVASQKRVYVSERKLKDTKFDAHNPLLYVKKTQICVVCTHNWFCGATQ
jgi:hypothetical protein